MTSGKELDGSFPLLKDQEEFQHQVEDNLQWELVESYDTIIFQVPHRG